MVYEIWLFPIALVGVDIPLVLPFDLSSSSSPHLNFPSITPLFGFISPLSLWYFSPSPIFLHPQLLTLHPSDPKPSPPPTYLYRMTFYSTKFFCLRESAGILDLAIFRKEALWKAREEECTVCPRQKEYVIRNSLRGQAFGRREI